MHSSHSLIILYKVHKSWHHELVFKNCRPMIVNQCIKLNHTLHNYDHNYATLSTFNTYTCRADVKMYKLHCMNIAQIGV